MKAFFKEQFMSEDNEIRIVFIGFWAFLLVTGIWFTVFIILWTYQDLGVAGFGDAFGALNTLFSGLAFIGVIIAILIQQNGLNIHRQELQLQKKELQETKEALIETAAAQAKQVSNQITTAKLQGLSALLDSYVQSTPRSKSELDKRTNIISQTQDEISLLLDDLYGSSSLANKFFKIYQENNHEQYTHFLLINENEFYSTYSIPKRMYFEYVHQMASGNQNLLKLHEIYKQASKIGDEIIDSIVTKS